MWVMIDTVHAAKDIVLNTTAAQAVTSSVSLTFTSSIMESSAVSQVSFIHKTQKIARFSGLAMVVFFSFIIGFLY